MALPIQSRYVLYAPSYDDSSYFVVSLSGLPIVFFFAALISSLISFIKLSNARDETFVSIANKESNLHEG